MDKFDFFSPFDYRYVDGQLKIEAEKFLSENARIRYQAKVEAALVRVLALHGVCSKKIADEISVACESVSAEEVYAEEKKIKHDVRALANVIRSKVSDDAKRFVHFSATSYDIVDTASALRYKETAKLFLLPKLKSLLNVWIAIALREKDTLQIGRTHGQHAEPITFGFTMSSYVNRLGMSIENIQNCADSLEGKFSGAVGSYNASSLIVKDPLKFESDVLTLLGLKCARHSTQIVNPETMLRLLNALMECFNVLANFSDDMRHLQRSEISEVMESFGEKQVGSSTMPHKRNPINFENVKSMWKAFLPRLITYNLDAISEHQRDLTNSASARFIPELFLALAVCVDRLERVSSNLVIDKSSMKKNFSISESKLGAEPLYILLAKYGHSNAHELVREITLEAEKNNKKFLEVALSNSVVKSFWEKFSEKEKNIVKNPVNYVGLSSKKTELVCKYWKKRLLND
ncbi:MAG: lyase family protein [Candidatus Diapherotrites archaeon]